MYLSILFDVIKMIENLNIVLFIIIFFYIDLWFGIKYDL